MVWDSWFSKVRKIQYIVGHWVLLSHASTHLVYNIETGEQVSLICVSSIGVANDRVYYKRYDRTVICFDPIANIHHAMFLSSDFIEIRGSVLKIGSQFLIGDTLQEIVGAHWVHHYQNRVYIISEKACNTDLFYYAFAHTITDVIPMGRFVLLKLVDGSQFVWDILSPSVHEIEPLKGVFYYDTKLYLVNSSVQIFF